MRRGWEWRWDGLMFFVDSVENITFGIFMKPIEGHKQFVALLDILFILTLNRSPGRVYWSFTLWLQTRVNACTSHNNYCFIILWCHTFHLPSSPPILRLPVKVLALAMFAESGTQTDCFRQDWFHFLLRWWWRSGSTIIKCYIFSRSLKIKTFANFEKYW